MANDASLSEKTLFYTAEQAECLQPNKISQGMYKCSTNVKRLLVYAIWKMQVITWADNRKNYRAEFTMAEFVSLLNSINVDTSTTQRRYIENALNELQDSHIAIDTGTEYHTFPWVEHSVYNRKEKKIIIELNHNLGDALFELRKQYTRIAMGRVLTMQSSYAYRFYELAMSLAGFEGKAGNKKGEWFFERTVEQVRKMFEMEAAEYAGRMDNFVKKVIENPLHEISEKTDITMTFEKNKAGRHIVGFRFSCKRKFEAPQKIEKNDAAEIKGIKIEINNEEETVQKLIKTNPERWKWLLDESLDRVGFQNKTLMEQSAKCQMLEEYKAGKIALDGSIEFQPENIVTGAKAETEMKKVGKILRKEDDDQLDLF